MKSMRKSVRGYGFRGLLNYSFDHDGGRVVGGNMLGENARDLAGEFKAVRQARPDVLKPVWHQALRLPAGEKLSDEMWAKIGDEYMQKMGFADDHPHVFIHHDLADGQHIHIVASRVSLTGQLWHGKNENLLSTKVVSELEKSFKLAISASPALDERTGLPSTQTSARKPKKGEVERALETGFKPPRMIVQDAIDRAIASGKIGTLDDLESHLHSKGIWTKPFVDEASGKVRGISFECDGSKFSGSQLGESYKFSKLLERIKHGYQNPASPADAQPARSSRFDQVQIERHASHPAVGRTISPTASARRWR